MDHRLVGRCFRKIPEDEINTIRVQRSNSQPTSNLRLTGLAELFVVHFSAICKWADPA